MERLTTMAQSFNITDKFVQAQNIGITSGAGETIALDDIPCAGFHNFGVSVFNYPNSGASISVVKLYGSEDQINWFNISGLSLSTIAANSLGHAETTAVFRFLRITTTGAAQIDVYLNGSV